MIQGKKFRYSNHNYFGFRNNITITPIFVFCKVFWLIVLIFFFSTIPITIKIQRIYLSGGDPTGTGKGGSSIYGKKFNDEIHEDLKHTGNTHYLVVFLDI